MLAAIARKEFLERLLSFRLFLATVLCVVVLPGVFYVRATEYDLRARGFPALVEARRREVRMWPREFYWTFVGCALARPLNPLTVLADPVDLRDGGEVELEFRDMPRHSPADVSNPVLSLFAAFNPLTFVTLVMSLMALVFSFDAVCGEKEQGTLKATLANPVPRATLLAGKWLGGLAALLLPFVLGSLVTAIVALVYLSGHLSIAHWEGMAMCFLLSCLLLAASYAGGILGSTLTRRSSTSAAGLLLAWSVVFLVYPNLVPVVAEQLRPLPGRRAYEEEVQQKLREVWQKALDEWNSFEAAHPTMKDEDPLQYSVHERTRYLNEMRLSVSAVEALNQEYARKLDAQVLVTSWLLRAVPSGSYSLAFHHVTGNSPDERSKLVASIARYKSDFFTYFANRSVEAMQERKDKNLPDLPPYTAGDFPLFAYRETGVAERLSWSLFDVVLLAAWNVLFFLASYMRFLRYDVS